MKLKSIILPLFAAVVFMTGCAKKEKEYIDPVLEVPTSLELTQAAGDQTIQIKATRAWRATISYEGTASDWLSVSPGTAPASMDNQTLTFTAKENSGRNRIANVKITIGLEDATIVVTQSGPGGSADPVYFNDFDKAAAVQTSSKWPYIYDSDCWRNETGTGITDITYVLKDNKATIRNNSNSSGSGVNNVFFGSSSRFCVKNIALPEGKTNYTISFCGIRNVYGASTGEGKSVFDSNVFKLYISADGEKWVALDYAFEGGVPDAEWGEATSTFTVPSGTKTLCIGVPTPSETSTYRIDDVKLDMAEAAGTAVDFTQGIEISEFKEETVIDPTKAEAKTVADFIATADESTYYKLTGTVSGFNSTYCSFDLTDETGKIYVYSVTEETKAKYASIIKNGGTVTLAGKYAYYATKQQHEVVEAVIIDFKEGQAEDPTKAEEKTVADFITTADESTYYKLTGTVSGFNSTYCSFDLTDATGKIYVYSVTEESKTKYVSQIKDGYTVTLAGKYYYYEKKSQYEVMEAVILSCGPGSGPYFSVSPLTISAPAAASTQTITITSNVQWTATCDNNEFSLDNYNGSDNGTITVTCPENQGPTERTATITLTTAAETSTSTYKVVLTQAAPGAAEYVLQTTKNSSNTAYAGMFDVTVNGIDWKLPGNQGLDADATYGGKIKIGGKLSSATDRYLYSKAPIGGALNKITFRHGSGDKQITVNSVKISTYATADDAANGTNALDTKDVPYEDNAETSINVSGDNWSGKYIRIVYNLSSSSPSQNKGIILFYVKFAY